MNTCETEQALKPLDKHENSSAVWQDEYTQHLSSIKPKQPGIFKYMQQKDYFIAGEILEDASAQKQEEFIKKVGTGEGKQGTLLGVFFPVMQNILGVLLFIRVPQITGEAGILDSFLIVVVCCCTTFLTILSLSGIATNGRISTGGTYYILSRSLGAPIGTAVGLSFYMGTTFAGAMYILGAVESFIKEYDTAIGGSDPLSMRVYGTILLVIIIFLNIVGLKYVARTGLVFLTIVLLAIIGMYSGLLSLKGRADDLDPLDDIESQYNKYGMTGFSKDNWNNNWGAQYVENNFFILLSIYFPSVTGIMAGSNRSGDLENPSVNIPRGTLGANLITSFIYLSFPVLFGATVDRGTLQTENYLMAAETALPHKQFVVIAILLSSTGAGLQSLAGAPRLLYAIADDENLPIFNKLKGSINKITILTGLICFGAIMIAEIDVITPIITMFFLLCYGCVNLCCLFLDLMKYPFWRPTWRFYHPFFSFIGLGLCLFLMVAISWWSFLIVMFLAACLFYYVTNNKRVNQNYGDSVEAVKLATAKSSLISMIKSSKHVKNWIPMVLVIGDYNDEAQGDDRVESKGALFFLDSIKQDISFAVYGSVQEGHFTIRDQQKHNKIKREMASWLENENMKVLTKCIQVEKRKETAVASNASQKEKDFYKQQDIKKIQQGLMFLMQGAGIGGLEPNTIMTEFPAKFKHDPYKAERFVQLVSYGVQMDKAIMVTVNDGNFVPKHQILTENDKKNNNQAKYQENQNLEQDQQKQEEEQEQLPKRTKQEQFTGNVDIWQFSYEKGLMQLLTFFLSRSKTWQKCKVRFYILTLKEDDSKDQKEEVDRIKERVSNFLQKYRISTKAEINVELINKDQYQQIEGFMLTQGKQDQLAHNPELQNQQVDPTSNYGMDLNNAPKQQPQQQQPAQQGGNGTKLNPQQQQQQPERALSVMSQNQVSLLNQKITTASGESDLVIMNLPEPVNQRTNDYCEYLRNLTQGLKRVVMVRNAAQECITAFT